MIKIYLNLKMVLNNKKKKILLFFHERRGNEKIFHRTEEKNCKPLSEKDLVLEYMKSFEILGITEHVTSHQYCENQYIF